MCGVQQVLKFTDHIFSVHSCLRNANQPYLITLLVIKELTVYRLTTGLRIQGQQDPPFRASHLVPSRQCRRDAEGERPANPRSLPANPCREVPGEEGGPWARRRRASSVWPKRLWCCPGLPLQPVQLPSRAPVSPTTFSHTPVSLMTCRQRLFID